MRLRCLVQCLNGLLLLGLCRFELRYFDPFLVLDEFSGGYLSVFLCFFMNVNGNNVGGC